MKSGSMSEETLATKSPSKQNEVMPSRSPLVSRSLLALSVGDLQKSPSGKALEIRIPISDMREFNSHLLH